MRLVSIIVTVAALGAGLLVLQRWVAETRTAAMILVAAWFAVIALAAWLATRGARAPLRRSVLGALATVAVGTVAIGYWTGVRDTRVSENVVMAARDADPDERVAGLAPAAPRTRPKRPSGPVGLSSGAIEGADGHAARGTVAVVAHGPGERRLTLTDFDVDPGPRVVVYLSPGAEDVDDVIELGSLKGNVGDQQYDIPRDADLVRYDTLILWCVPFTTRIATAKLR